MGCGGSKSTKAEDALKRHHRKKARLLSDALVHIFNEDLELFLKLPNDV